MQERRITKRTTASLTGYAILLGIGFLQYFLLSGVNNTCEILIRPKYCMESRDEMFVATDEVDSPKASRPSL